MVLKAGSQFVLIICPDITIYNNSLRNLFLFIRKYEKKTYFLKLLLAMTVVIFLGVFSAFTARSYKKNQCLFMVKKKKISSRCFFSIKRMKIWTLRGDSTAGDKNAAPAGIAGEVITELMHLWWQLLWSCHDFIAHVCLCGETPKHNLQMIHRHWRRAVILAPMENISTFIHLVEGPYVFPQVDDKGI